MYEFVNKIYLYIIKYSHQNTKQGSFPFSSSQLHMKYYINVHIAYEQYGWTIDTVILCCVRCFDNTRTLML